MRTTQAARYARWSAMVALLLAATVAGAYVRRAWQEHEARKTAPSSVPAAVAQQSAAFSYSQVVGDRTEFTVHASHTTQFTGGDRYLLEDVWVSVYGKAGDRADNLHTRTCEYLDSIGSIRCDGSVQIDLQSASDAKLFPSASDRSNPGAHIVHIVTSRVTFDRKTGEASTDQPVSFRFPEGIGTAVGLRYDSHEGQLQLLRDVDFTFSRTSPSSDDSPVALSAMPATPAVAIPAAAIVSGTPSPSVPPPAKETVSVSQDDQPLHICGTSLLYRRDDRIIHLQGPVQAQQGRRQLQSGHLAIELDPEMHARRIVATGQPKLRGMERGEPVMIAATELSAEISPEGWARKLSAVGNVHAIAHAADHEDRLDAGRADLSMAPGSNDPHQLVAVENVVAESVAPAGVRRTLTTSTLTLDFANTGKSTKQIESAEISASGANDVSGSARITHAATPHAVLDWIVPAAGSANVPAQHVHLTTNQLDASFGSSNDLREVRGAGGVEVQRQIGNGPVAVSTSREMVVHLATGGDWSTIDQSGDVRLRQFDHAAQADQAHFDRLNNTAALSGSVILSDAQSHVTAKSATFDQLTNHFHAEGHVVSSEVSAENGGASNVAPAQARISADHLDVDTLHGRAVYSGEARLWQGDSLIQADTITLDRAAHVLTADKHVRAVFPQAAWSPAGNLPSNRLSSPRSASTANAKPEFWRAEADRFTYSSERGTGRLEQNVYTHSIEGSIRADAIDLFFAPGNPSKSVSASAVTGSAPQQLTRATALGNVLVEEEERRGKAARADYTASEGKFVLSGGAPVVYDASGNSTSGRELTLFFADDRIVIDSAEGLRTLTLHRVEK